MSTGRPLTTRQHQILRLVARGLTNKEIGAQLGISEQGVKVHISRLLQRYRADNRVELVNLTRAWADADARGYAALSADLAKVREQLAAVESSPAVPIDEIRSTGEPGLSRELGRHLSALSPQAPTDLLEAVRALRELLTEVNVAVKLARELPADAAAGPLLDAMRTRMQAALQQSENLAELVAAQAIVGPGDRAPVGIAN
jgi:DNA-binding CsgD family transcriptional regulator